MTEELRTYSGGKTISSINDAGKTGQPHAKEWDWTPILHLCTSYILVHLAHKNPIKMD